MVKIIVTSGPLLESIVRKSEIYYKDISMSHLDSVWNEVNSFYNDISPRDNYERIILRVNGIDHISKVVNNVEKIYDILGKEASEDVLIAAMCHDLGYLVGRFEDVEKNWNETNGDKHHIYSARILRIYLKKMGFSDERIAGIQRLVVAHNEYPERLTEETEKIIYTADKLTRLGTDGLDRLCLSRGYDNSDAKRGLDILKSVERKMDQAYAELKRVGIASSYVENKYKEGKKALYARRKQLERRIYGSKDYSNEKRDGYNQKESEENKEGKNNKNSEKNKKSKKDSKESKSNKGKNNSKKTRNTKK